MKKRKLHVLLLSATIMVGLIGTSVVSCRPNTETPDNPDNPDNPDTPDTPAEKNIKSVAITGYDETTVLDGSIVTLKAQVTPVDSTKEFSTKVTWTSSDEEVATVKNGAVTFKKVTSDSTVTITAKSNEDETKTAQVTFEVKHSPIDIYNSKGQELDTSVYFDDGTMSVQPGDVALISADAHGKKFYFEAEIQIDSIAETENYPKIGIMVADNPDGNWCGQGDGIRSGFFYLDAIKSNLAAGVSTYGFVASDEVNANWNWGQKPTNDFAAGKAVKIGTKFKMGLLRNGTQYILFTENAETGEMEAKKSFVWDKLDSETDAYTWIGGFNTGMTVGGFKSYVGEDVDKLFKAPTSITLNADQELYLNDTYQTNYTLDSTTYDMSKLVFTSSDETVATVDANGFVRAKDKVGQTTITASYGEVSASYVVKVTDDISVKVVLDGKRDDAIWNEAKEKPIYLTRDENNFEDFYCVKTPRGVYVSADLFTRTIHNTAEGWYQGDNFEFKLSADDVWSNQLWFSTVGGNSNMKDVFVTNYTEVKGGLNLVSIEALIPYSAISPTASVDSKIFAGNGFGANPGGAAWHAVAGNHEVTTTGFADGAKHDCSEGHYVVSTVSTKEATCNAEGKGVNHCRYCDETTETSTPKIPHEADEDTITTVTEPTKESVGRYSATCKACGETFEFDGTRGLNRLDAPITHDHLANGWNDRNTWTVMFENLEGDFKYNIEAHMEGGGTKADGNYEAGANCWRTLLPVIYALDGEDNILDSATFRMDWFGWQDDRNGDGVTIGTSQENGGTWCDWANEIATAVKDCEVTYTFEKVGKDLTITTRVHSNTYEKDYEPMVQRLKGINYDAISLAFASEGTYAVINDFYVVK